LTQQGDNWLCGLKLTPRGDHPARKTRASGAMLRHTLYQLNLKTRMRKHIGRAQAGNACAYHANGHHLV
jgi:hypothetical protein